MMPSPDYSDWLTKQDAARTIGCSLRTLEKLMAENRIQVASVKSGSGQNVAVLHPSDVERIREERAPKPFVAARGDNEALAVRETAAVTPERLLTALAMVLQRASEPAKLPTTYVTLSEAAEITGLPEARLRQWIREKKIDSIRTKTGPLLRRADVRLL